MNNGAWGLRWRLILFHPHDWASKADLAQPNLVFQSKKKRFRLARDFSLRQRYATLVINDKKKPLEFNQQQNGSWVANQVDSYQPMLYLLSN